MTGATIGGTTRSVTYDDVGNITSKTRLGSTNTNSYSYPTPGSAKPYSVSSITGVVNGVTNPTFSYDDNGNMTSGAGRSVTWTAFNRVTSITEGSLTVSFVYDAEHQRIKQSDGSIVTRFLNDPIAGVQSEYLTSDGGTFNDYLFADGERVGVRTKKTSPSSTTFQGFVADHERSVTVVTDSSGSIVQNLAYDVWGRRRNPNGTEDPTGAITAPTTRGYTDHQHLPGGVNGIHLINMNARIYDPEVGRFMSADPTIPDMFNSQTLNRLTYVRNNPGTRIDPTGFNSFEANSSRIDMFDNTGYQSIFYGMQQVYYETLFEHSLMADIINSLAGTFDLFTSSTGGSTDLSSANENFSGYIDLGPSQPIIYGDDSPGDFDTESIPSILASSDAVAAEGALNLIRKYRDVILSVSESAGVNPQYVASIIYQERLNGIWATARNVPAWPLAVGGANSVTVGLANMDVNTAARIMGFNVETMSYIERFQILRALGSDEKSIELIALNIASFESKLGRSVTLQEATFGHNAGIDNLINSLPIVIGSDVSRRSWGFQDEIAEALR
ncbi:MAG: RHS repeat-associated core domain-containing protein [Gammaproteobacteria bacterium]|nr:hypothetical protein [Pseudomonadales bacterium]